MYSTKRYRSWGRCWKIVRRRTLALDDDLKPLHIGKSRSPNFHHKHVNYIGRYPPYYTRMTRFTTQFLSTLVPTQEWCDADAIQVQHHQKPLNLRYVPQVKEEINKLLHMIDQYPSIWRAWHSSTSSSGEHFLVVLIFRSRKGRITFNSRNRDKS